jgi:hypothetical protein
VPAGQYNKKKMQRIYGLLNDLLSKIYYKKIINFLRELMDRTYELEENGPRVLYTINRIADNG